MTGGEKVYLDIIKLLPILSIDLKHVVFGETPKRVLLQTVKTQMKCHIMRHFIKIYTVCKGKKDLQTKEYNI